MSQLEFFAGIIICSIIGLSVAYAASKINPSDPKKPTDKVSDDILW